MQPALKPREDPPHPNGLVQILPLLNMPAYSMIPIHSRHR